MPRRASSTVPSSALALAVSERRGSRTQAEAAAEVGVTQRTMSAVERGAPLSLDTALKLGRWLGWPVERVVEEAGKPAGGGA
jgi:DNA-binding XRE family transcriptional regulator